MADYEFIVIDPVIGEVSVGETEAEALEYAVNVGGKAFERKWVDGYIVANRPL